MAQGRPPNRFLYNWHHVDNPENLLTEFMGTGHSWRVATNPLTSRAPSGSALRLPTAPPTPNGRFVVVVLGGATHRSRLHPRVDRRAV
jgi:hypothetical protein